MSKMKLTVRTLAASTIALGLLNQACASGNTKPMKKVTKTAEAIKNIKTKKASSFPASVNKPMPGEIIVKCAGIAKKGQNHCGANGHTCGGKAKTDFDKNEWVYVRKEVCDVTPGRVVGKKRVVKG